MTALVAILNRSAVALAADSAVSIQHGRGFKIYETHKLFNLSKAHPVGIMIYQNASLMSVPWETIIKQFRDELGEEVCATLAEYGERFTSYLNGNKSFFPEAVQNEWTIAHVKDYLLLIGKRIDGAIEKLSHGGRVVKPSQIRSRVRDEINLWYDGLEKRDFLQTLSVNFGKDIATKFGGDFDNLINEIFQTLPLNKALTNRLKQICVWLLIKDMSGVETSY